MFDADNHYYEAEDAFMRHGDESVRRYVRWVAEGEAQAPRSSGPRCRTASPTRRSTRSPRPGVFHATAEGPGGGHGGPECSLRQLDVRRARAASRPAYRDRDAAPADARPTRVSSGASSSRRSGDCVEGLMHDDVTMAYKVFHAFNLWLEEDWGYGYRDRLYAPPYIPMLDPAAGRPGARIRARPGGRASCRSGPARPPGAPRPTRSGTPSGPGSTRPACWRPTTPSAARPVYDESFRADVGAPSRSPTRVSVRPLGRPHLGPAASSTRSSRSCSATSSAASRTSGWPASRWAATGSPYCLHVLDHAGGILERRMSTRSACRLDRLPSDIFKEHVYVSPFPEEDVVGLADLIGADRVLFGSDWPHAEGTSSRSTTVSCLNKRAAEDVKKIMRDNALDLVPE